MDAKKRKLGIFVAHADGSIMLATHPIIASEFNDLENSSWLITGFSLAAAATQALVRFTRLGCQKKEAMADKVVSAVRQAQ